MQKPFGPEYALVPRKPTAEMLVAAIRATGTNLDTACRVFSAMVDLAERELALRAADAAEADSTAFH